MSWKIILYLSNKFPKMLHIMKSGNSGLKRHELQLSEFVGKPENFDRLMKNFVEIVQRKKYNKLTRYSCVVKQLKEPGKILITKSPATDMNTKQLKVFLQILVINTLNSFLFLNNCVN